MFYDESFTNDWNNNNVGENTFQGSVNSPRELKGKAPRVKNVRHVERFGSNLAGYRPSCIPTWIIGRGVN